MTNLILILFLVLLGSWCLYQGIIGVKKYKHGYGLIIHTMSIEETIKTSNSTQRLTLVSVSMIYIMIGILAIILPFILLYNVKS